MDLTGDKRTKTLGRQSKPLGSICREPLSCSEFYKGTISFETGASFGDRLDRPPHLRIVVSVKHFEMCVKKKKKKKN